MKLFSRVFFCMLILANYALYALDTGKISGVVKESGNLTPLEADVKLFTNDTVFVKGIKCSPDGAFTLDGLPFGKYKLELSLMEYSSVALKDIELNAVSPVKMFDTLHLKKQDVTTDEILVEDEKDMMTLTGDKKVYNVDKTTMTKGGTAIDVLKKVPMVDVDADDNVSMRGSQNVKILIDDKPSRYASLKQIPADAIEKIELITNPSAKYESEGVTGLINIVMKKNNNLGFTGNLTLGMGYKDRYNGGADISLKKDRWSLFGSTYIGSQSNFVFNHNGGIDYFNPVSYYRNTARGTNSHKYLYSQGSAEFEFVKGNTIGFEASINTGGWENLNTARGENLNSSFNLMSYNSRINNFKGIWQGYYLSLYYNGKLNEEGRELSGDISLTRNRNGMNNNLDRQDFDENGNPVSINPYLQYDQTNIKTYVLNAQLDFTNPFSAETKMEAGYRGIFRRNDNDFASDSLDYLSGSYIRNIGNSNHFNLDEYINAVYGVFSSSLAGFNYKLGLRLEQTNIKGDLLTGLQDFKKSYLDFFPTVSISRKIGNMHQLQASYSRRVTRPNVWRLNPFANRNDPKVVFMGNPDLNPEFTDSYELSYSLFTPAITITPMFFYRQSHDVISNYSYLEDSSVLVTTYRNAKGSKAYGMDLVLSSKPTSWLNLNGTLSMYNTKFDEDPISDYASEEGFSWKGNIRATFTLGTLLNLELYYNYVGKKINAQGKNIPTQNFDMSISRAFLNDKLNVSFRANDVFKTMEWGQDINSSGYRGIYRNNFDSRTFYINFSYKFGNTDESYQKKKKVKQNNNEQNDQQDNNGTGR